MRSLAQVSVQQLKGVGPKMLERLEKIGIHSIQDLLFHLPLRYEDRTHIYAIADLRPQIHGTVQGTVERSEIVNGKRRMMTVNINDGTGRLTLRFFHFSAAQKQTFATGAHIRCYGEVRRGHRGYEITHPEYKFVEEDAIPELDDVLTPVYPTTDGLKQASLRNLTEQALTYLESGRLDELLPKEFAPNQLSLGGAIYTLHRPTPDISITQLETGTHPAQQRLIFEELLAQNLSMLKLRQHHHGHQSIPMTIDEDVEAKFLSLLPFSPTNAQHRVVQEIRHDLKQSIPMMRLVQGDVGSGKTLVAALSALTAISQGYQVALMAPTELLAEQHAISFQNWFEQLNIQVAWLAGKSKGKARATALDMIASGNAQMVVGTHALFQEQVVFNNLALVIIDEQHRFGVHQRLELRAKGASGDVYPHQLVMTATPIPRTLAMTAYADMDTSIIDELPPGRTPINTIAVPDSRRENIIARVEANCLNEGRQAYWVCTLIEESEVLQCQAAEDTAAALIEALPDLKIGLVHGRMKAQEKQSIMAEFKAGHIHLLVATTVIEVGVDVPNASLMIIENPERLGLAQLHQLRGRVGRGSIASHCVLLYQAPLSKTAQKRLGVLRETNDGFVISQRDLEIRGPGEILGTRQTGIAELKVADLVRDAYLIPDVHRAAGEIWQLMPEIAPPLILRWLGNKQKYAQA